MKKILLAGALALIAAPALAADLPRRTAAVAPAPVYAAPVFTWTGFYVGAQAGYGWGKDKYSIVSAPAVAPFSTSPTGVLGGVHAGYNWQSGAFVYGLDADLEYANQKDKHSITAPAALTFSSTIGTSGSLRLRAGYAFDRTLLYVTAGLAGADIKQTVLNGAITTKTSGVEYGWTAGVGLEHAFTQNWSARIEYRYTDFGTSKWAGTVIVPATAKFDTTDQTVRVGLSYRFGGAARPVMARY